MEHLSLSKIQSQLRAGGISTVDLVKGYLNQIEATADLNIYVDIYETEILQAANSLDQKIKSGKDLGKCFGLVLSVKDVICQKDHTVTAGSGILQGFNSLFTSTALQRLLDEDALVIGKVNCDQFGMGSSNENSVYGPTKNADDPQRTPGGSSGASAVSVQANTCLLSLGSDTGGSVRQPAGFTGVYGFKPSYGRISRYGLIAYGSSFDQIGVMGRNVKDIALVLELMSGKDELDPTTVDLPVPSYSSNLEFSGKAKIAYFPEAMDHPGLDPEIRSAHLDLIAQLNEEGHECEAVHFDLINYIVPAYYTLTTAEASTNLARYDGIRYGKNVESEHDLSAQIIANRSEGFLEEVKRRIMLGTFVLSSGYYEAYYGKAQKVRRLLKERSDEIFKDHDFILMPVSPVPAWKIGEKGSDPVEMYLADIYTVLANLTGNPALAIPLKRHQNGTMFAYQLQAQSFSEAKLLAFTQTISRKFLKN